MQNRASLFPSDAPCDLFSLLQRALGPRDGMLVSLLAYSGLRPQEAVRRRWGHVMERTMVVHAPKTRRHNPQPRTVKLLGPLRKDLLEWQMA